MVMAPIYFCVEVIFRANVPSQKSTMDIISL
jgi:hypothetical protein